MSLSEKEITKKRELALKLLALGGNNDNPHEKAAALLKAEAICREIGITLHQLKSPLFTSYTQWQQQKPTHKKYEYTAEKSYPFTHTRKPPPIKPHNQERVRALNEIESAESKGSLSGFAKRLRYIVTMIETISINPKKPGLRKLLDELNSMSVPGSYSIAFDCVVDYAERCLNET